MAQDTAGMEVGNASWLGKRESFKAKRRNGRGCIMYGINCRGRCVSPYLPFFSYAFAFL